jgi:hypothetical protein
MKLSDGFITGCDANSEWMLPWFFSNYQQHNDTPIAFMDFGVSSMGMSVVKEFASKIIPMSHLTETGWFKKPKAMMMSPFQRTVWLDTDCEVLDDISGIFKLIKPNMLNMVEDKPWTMRRKEIWHNSGVVGFIGLPPILNSWAQHVELRPQVGDQEVLHSILNPITKIQFINDLPNEYNVMRLQMELDGYNGPAKIKHWTGAKGKDVIRSLSTNV